MTDYFRLASGRFVFFQRFHVWPTHENILAGDPVHIRREVWKRTPEKVRRLVGEGAVILEPAEGMLPDYTCVAQLHSDPLPADPREDYSHLSLCWFEYSMDGNVLELVKNAFGQVCWEEHARNWSD